MEYTLRGRAWKFGDNIFGDWGIIPFEKVREFQRRDPDFYKSLAEVCMINLNPNFPKRVKKGDFIVAGKYFGGCWLHNHCAYAIKGCGVGAVIADSIFSFLYRALIDLVGVPVLIGEGVSSKIRQDDELEVNIKTGEIQNLTSGEVIKVEPIPEILLEILSAGSLVAYIKSKFTDDQK